jgi:hypothetical protein
MGVLWLFGAIAIVTRKLLFSTAIEHQHSVRFINEKLFS